MDQIIKLSQLNEFYLLFPEFIEDNYWNEKFSDWHKEGFSKEDKEIIFEKDANGNIIEDPNMTFERAKSIIKERWVEQAEIGTAIHKGMEIFFSYDKVSKVMIRTLPDD